jgi:hypothetical protein
MNFEDFFKVNFSQESEYILIEKDAAKTAWDGCKREILKIVDKYSHTSAYPYIKERIKNL